MPMNKKQHLDQRGFGHVLFFLLFIIVVFGIFATFKLVSDRNKPKGGGDIGSVESTDPVTKGKALSNGQCEGKGSSKLTHAPMDVKDVSSIEPMGLMVGGHVTPVDHEYYYQKDKNAAYDTYPVYADGDGIITAVQFVNDGQKDAWWVTISHSCTFMSNYNLMTSINPGIKSKLPAGWGPNSNGNVHIAVKAGDEIGKVGHQSLDYQVWDTTKTLKGLLHPMAYNNREPWKIHTVQPLNYFTDDVKSQILPLYARTIEPRDGKIDYDVSGQAVGNWFLEGSNGYAGSSDQSKTIQGYYTGHLALAYDYIDGKTPIFSIGDYNGQPTQFTIVGDIDWTKIVPGSGVTKIQLKISNTPTATALLELTAKEKLKLEVFPGKTPSEVSSFDSKAKTYDRGQNATMPISNTASN